MDGKAYACDERGLAHIVGAADHDTDRLRMRLDAQVSRSGKTFESSLACCHDCGRLVVASFSNEQRISLEVDIMRLHIAATCSRPHTQPRNTPHFNGATRLQSGSGLCLMARSSGCAPNIYKGTRTT